MRRVVITGIGIVCPIGNNTTEVEASLRAGKSGITFQQDYADHGFRSQVAGIPDIVLADVIDKRQLRFMGPTAAYAAAKQVIRGSWNNGLEDQLAFEAREQGKCGKSRDFKEGVLAFTEKRRPTFEGR